MQSDNFHQSDVDKLMSHTEKKDYVGVDILLSSEWPSDVTIGTSPPVSVHYNSIHNSGDSCDIGDSCDGGDSSC